MSIEYIGEFGVELSTAIPYAYHLFLKDKLIKTTSVKGTSELYYFSKNHNEKKDSRKPNDSIPSNSVLCKGAKSWRDGRRNTDYWKPPPYKEYYKNDLYDYNLIIYNKFSNEWGTKQYNFLDLHTLESIINLLSSKFKIIYIRAIGNEKNYVKDCQNIPKFNDMELMNKYKIPTIQDILKENPEINFNKLQLQIMANCDRFISVQGGPSYICSYFGGTNIIYHTKGHELEKGAYRGYFTQFSNSNIIVCQTYKDLNTTISRVFL